MNDLIAQAPHDQAERVETRRKMLRAVALVTDGPAFYQKAEAFGRLAARALGRSKRSQITGLESLANSSRKVTDIFDYVKLRTARQREWRQDNLGPDLLAHLETGLPADREHVLRLMDLTDPDPVQQQEIYMLLIRAFLAHIAAHYEYACQIQDISS